MKAESNAKKAEKLKAQASSTPKRPAPKAPLVASPSVENKLLPTDNKDPAAEKPVFTEQPEICADVGEVTLVSVTSNETAPTETVTPTVEVNEVDVETHEAVVEVTSAAESFLVETVTASETVTETISNTAEPNAEIVVIETITTISSDAPPAGSTAEPIVSTADEAVTEETTRQAQPEPTASVAVNASPAGEFGSPELNGVTAESIEDGKVEMNGSGNDRPVTGYATEEEYKAVLAEKRRVAREAKERELELERLRQVGHDTVSRISSN